MAQEEEPGGLEQRLRSRIRQLRLDHGLSVRELVEAMNGYGVSVSRSTWSNYENNMRDDLTLREAVAISLVLDVDLVDLVVGPDESWGRVELGDVIFTLTELRRSLAAGKPGLSRAQLRQAEKVRKFFDDIIGDRDDER